MAERGLHVTEVETTLDLFRAAKCDELLKSKSKIDDIYLIQISDKLSQVGIAANDPFIRRNLAKGILFENKEICANADPSYIGPYTSHVHPHNVPNIPDEFREATIKEIYSYYQLRRDTKDYAFLLISAPCDNTTTIRSGVCLNRTQDQQFREAQLRQFLTAVLLDVDQEEHVIYETAVVHDEHSLDQVTESFLRRAAKQALHAMIVFNGHGSVDGMRLDRQLCQSMRVDSYISLAHLYWKEYLHYEPDELPARLFIVFAQCYAHLRSPSPDSRITAIEFSDEENEMTYSEFDITHLDQATHQQLQVYATLVNDDIHHVIEYRRAPSNSTQSSTGNSDHMSSSSEVPNDDVNETAEMESMIRAQQM